MDDLPIISEEALVDLRNKIFAAVDDQDPRVCGAALCYCIAAIGLTVGMTKEKVLMAAIYSINEAWTEIEGQRTVIEESEPENG